MHNNACNVVMCGDGVVDDYIGEVVVYVWGCVGGGVRVCSVFL